MDTSHLQKIMYKKTVRDKLCPIYCKINKII